MTPRHILYAWMSCPQSHCRWFIDRGDSNSITEPQPELKPFKEIHMYSKATVHAVNYKVESINLEIGVGESS